MLNCYTWYPIWSFLTFFQQYLVFFLGLSSGSLFTNSNWFAFEEDRDRVANERSTGSLASPSPNAEEGGNYANENYNVTSGGEDEDLADTATSSPEAEPKLEPGGTDKPVEWVEWRESLDAGDPSEVLPNGELETKSENNEFDAAESPSPTSSVTLTKDEQMATVPSESLDEQTAAAPSESLDENPNIETSDPTQTGSDNVSSLDGTVAEVEGDSSKDTKDDKKEIEHVSS